MVAQKILSFSEIVHGRESSVRITDDCLLYAVDLVMVVSGKNRNDAGWTLRNIPEETFPSVKITDRKMPGKGNAHTKLLTFQNAVELVMVLPGQIAKETRTKFANIIHRFMAGDSTLVADIQANAASDAPINQMARDTMDTDFDQTEIEDQVEVTKRRRLEIAMDIKNVASFCDLMDQLRPNWKSDQDLVLQTEHWLRNAVFPTISRSNAPKSISQVAKELGMVLKQYDYVKAGQLAAQAYRSRYGCLHHPHRYTEADRDLVVAALRAI